MTFCLLDLANTHDALSIRLLYPRIYASTPRLQNLEGLEPNHGVSIVLTLLYPLQKLPACEVCVPCSFSGRLCQHKGQFLEEGCHLDSGGSSSQSVGHR